MGCKPRVIPDKAGHPTFPHIQSIEYAEHADQPRACFKTKEKQQNRSLIMENVDHADDQREKKRKIGKGSFVRDGFGRYGI